MINDDDDACDDYDDGDFHPLAVIPEIHHHIALVVLLVVVVMVVDGVSDSDSNDKFWTCYWY